MSTPPKIGGLRPGAVPRPVTPEAPAAEAPQSRGPSANTPPEPPHNRDTVARGGRSSVAVPQTGAAWAPRPPQANPGATSARAGGSPSARAPSTPPTLMSEPALRLLKQAGEPNDAAIAFFLGRLDEAIAEHDDPALEGLCHDGCDPRHGANPELAAALDRIVAAFYN